MFIKFSITLFILFIYYRHHSQALEEDLKNELGPRLDVVFVIDATGSMSDEISIVKQELIKISHELSVGTPKPRVRFGLVAYRDKFDEFITNHMSLTYDINSLSERISSVDAAGGGDWEEHVAQGLHIALSPLLKWDLDSSVRRIMYLIGDAPAQYYPNDYTLDTAVELARSQQITINVIGCSGLESALKKDGNDRGWNTGIQQFEWIAKQTGGRYVTLTYQQKHSNVETGETTTILYSEGKAYEVLAKSADKEHHKDGSKDDAEEMDKDYLSWDRAPEDLVTEKILREVSSRSDGYSSYSSYSSPSTAVALENNLRSLVTTSIIEELKEKGTKY